jgi:SNF2 family DNA or RNA helicase
MIQLRSYQRLAVDFLLTTPKAALFADMGLGKTLASLVVADLLLALGEVTKILVIAPKRVAITTWPDEVQKWPGLRHLELSILLGPKATRWEAMASRAPIHVINFDNLPWLFKTLGKAWDYDMVIVDESSKVKDYGSVRFAGKPNRKVRNEDGSITKTPGHPGLKWASERTPRWVNLTGTPAPNGVMDLWSQVYLLDGGARLGSTITSYRERWFSKGYDGFTWTPKPGAADEIAERIKDICLTIKAKDYLDLPPMVETFVRVPLPDSIKEIYRKLAKDFFIRLEGGEVSAANAAVLSGKLLQAGNGFLYTETGYEVLHDAKIDALEELVEEMDGKPLLVVYHFQADLARLQARFPQAVPFGDDPTIVGRFNRGEIPILLTHPKSAGHGLNLQEACNHAVFYSVDWDLESHQQVIERIGPTRQFQAGKDNPVFIHYLLAEGTLDQVVFDRITSKATVQDALKSAMQNFV